MVRVKTVDDLFNATKLTGDYRTLKDREKMRNQLKDSAVDDLKKAKELTFKAPEIRTKKEQMLINAIDYIKEKFNIKD